MFTVTVVSLLAAHGFRANVTRKEFPQGRGPHVLESSSRFISNFSKDAEYCLNVHVGDQPFCLDLDTGSSDIGIRGRDCKRCQRKNNKPYDPEGGDTAEATDCKFCKSHMTKDTSISCKYPTRNSDDKTCVMEMSYADDTGFSAALYHDSMSFDGADDMKFDQIVGDIYKVDEYTDPRTVDGIIGFAGMKESAANVSPAMDSFVKQHTNVEDVFSLCLREYDGAAYIGAEPGITDNENVKWTKRLDTSGFYTVDIKDVLVDGESLGVSMKMYNDGEAIVDSGTSDSCFSDTAMKALKKAFMKMCHGNSDLPGLCSNNAADSKKRTKSIFEDKCVTMTEEQRMRFPNITVAFTDGTEVEITPKGYLRNDSWLCDRKGQYTIGISSCGEDGSGTIMGVTMMTDHIVVFDRAQEQIGFLPGYPKCP